MLDLEHDPFRCSRRSHDVERSLDALAEVGRRHLHPDLARDDAGDVEDIGDELREDPCVSLDDLDHTFLPTFANMSEAQHPHVAHHGVQRCSQLVGEHREELVFHTIGFFGLSQHAALERDVPRDLGGANDRPVGILNRGDRQRDLDELPSFR